MPSDGQKRGSGELGARGERGAAAARRRKGCSRAGLCSAAPRETRGFKGFRHLSLKPGRSFPSFLLYLGLFVCLLLRTGETPIFDPDGSFGTVPPH